MDRVFKIARNVKWIVPLLGLLFFVVALIFLTHFLKEHSYSQLQDYFRSVSGDRIAIASLVTVLAYGVLSCYDLLAFKYAQVKLPAWRIIWGSFTAFAFSNSIGLANLAGSSVRMRIYSSYGVPPLKILQIIAFVSISFWLGFLSLAGFSFAAFGLDLSSFTNVNPVMIRWLGLLFLALVFSYLFYSAASNSKFKIKNIDFEIPNFKLSLSQVFISCLDWALAALVLYLLLPASSTLSFPSFLSVFLAAQVIALISHVPAGIGILEAIVIYFVGKNHHATPDVVASLIIFRLLYYILPLTIAGMGLVFFELNLRRTALTLASRKTFEWIKPIAPSVSGIFAFLAGAVLLVSGATPSVAARSDFLIQLLPLTLIEASHFLGSCLGVILLLISLSLMNRNRAAWAAGIASLMLGAVLSILKGLDFEEATILSIFAIFLYFSKSEFYRPSRLFSDIWGPRWIVTVLMVIGGSVWIGFFAYRHVEYSHDLWWSFSLDENAPRFLRATVGVLFTSLCFGIIRLLSNPNTPGQTAPVPLDSILATVRQSSDTMSNLALLGDKQIFQSKDSQTFLMYAVQGRTWVVLGDPVGNQENIDDLIHDFRKLADVYSGQVVFYQIRSDLIPNYIDLGMMFLKLGEEAQIPLLKFSLEGHTKKNLRASYNKIKKQGIEFKIIPASEWSKISKEIKTVSDQWLAEKKSTEKGFSLGYFDEKYLSLFPIAVLEANGKIVAFANVWEGADKKELSIDLMRYLPSGPHGMMEHLTVELLLWGKECGFQFFNLGMAPLSGLESGAMGSRWNRVGRLLFEHAERFYNFQGLRRYKDKFDPEWQPRFLAYSSKLTLPIVLKDLTVLISGGIKEVVTK